MKFLKASFKGWAFCRDNAEECPDIVVAKGSKLGASHQLWQVNEINKLVWPAPQGIGIASDADWDRTVEIAMGTKNAEGQTVITEEPAAEAHTNEYAQKALDELKTEGVDVTGDTFEPVKVTLEAGGS